MSQAVTAQISNDIAALYKELFGRGPTHTRTHWAGPDVLVVVLEDTLTRAERALVAMDADMQLLDTRMFFQQATITDFCRPVERATGRKVRAFTSGLDARVDGLSVETFVLHPPGYDGPSRAEQGPPRATAPAR